MSSSTIEGRMKNIYIQSNLEVALIEDKMREECLRCFLYLHRKPIEATVRKIDWFEVITSPGG